jgi:hypothetical protein
MGTDRKILESGNNQQRNNTYEAHLLLFLSSPIIIPINTSLQASKISKTNTLSQILYNPIHPKPHINPAQSPQCLSSATKNPSKSPSCKKTSRAAAAPCSAARRTTPPPPPPAPKQPLVVLTVMAPVSFIAIEKIPASLLRENRSSTRRRQRDRRTRRC